MDGIEAILQAEQEAERIRRDARIEADALLGSAEGYRQRALEAARREGEDEKQRLLDNARKRAEDRKAELRVVAEVKNAELRSEAEKRLEETAKQIAERIAGF
jgi:vacuolar-type H+-ATPase subunit H